MEKGKCVGNKFEPPPLASVSLETLCAANQQTLSVLADRSPVRFLRHLEHTDLLRSWVFRQESVRSMANIQHTRLRLSIMGFEVRTFTHKPPTVQLYAHHTVPMKGFPCLWLQHNRSTPMFNTRPLH